MVSVIMIQSKIESLHNVWFPFNFRDGSADKTDYPREACEHVLARKLPEEAKAAYLWGTYFEK